MKRVRGVPPQLPVQVPLRSGTGLVGVPSEGVEAHPPNSEVRPTKAKPTARRQYSLGREPLVTARCAFSFLRKRYTRASRTPRGPSQGCVKEWGGQSSPRWRDGRAGVMSDLAAILRLLSYAALIVGSMVILDWFDSKRSRGRPVRRRRGEYLDARRVSRFPEQGPTAHERRTAAS